MRALQAYGGACRSRPLRHPRGAGPFRARRSSSRARCARRPPFPPDGGRCDSGDMNPARGLFFNRWEGRTAHSPPGERRRAINRISSNGIVSSCRPWHKEANGPRRVREAKVVFRHSGKGGHNGRMRSPARHGAGKRRPRRAGSRVAARHSGWRSANRAEAATRDGGTGGGIGRWRAPGREIAPAPVPGLRVADAREAAATGRREPWLRTRTPPPLGTRLAVFEERATPDQASRYRASSQVPTISAIITG